MSDTKLKNATKYIVQRATQKDKRNKESLERYDAQRHRGQILVMNSKTQASMLKKFFDITLSKTELDQMMSEIDTFLKGKQPEQFRKLEKDAGEQRVKHVQKLLKQAETQPGDKAYLVNSYEVAKSQKLAKGTKNGEADSVSAIQSRFVNKLERRRDKKPISSKEISSKQQLGHGDRGAAASQFGVDRAISEAVAEFNLSVKQEAQLRTIASKHRERYGIKVNVTHDQMFTDGGKFKKDFAFILTYQDFDINSEEGKLEKKSKQDALAEFDFVGQETSTKVRDALAQTHLNSLAGQSRKNKKVKGKKRQKIHEKNKVSESFNFEREIHDSYQIQKGVSAKGVKRSKKRKTSARGIASQPLTLLAILNKELPDTIRKNMNPPALENRSGTFADSVRVTDVSRTAKGFPSVGYTYKKNPYQVFEMGSGDQRWATPERDPRTLIDRSIREIAAQFAMGRFYTRRQ